MIDNLNIDNLISEIEEEFADKFTEVIELNGHGSRVFKQQVYREDVETFLIRKLRLIAEKVSENHKKQMQRTLNELQLRSRFPFEEKEQD